MQLDTLTQQMEDNRHEKKVHRLLAVVKKEVVTAVEKGRDDTVQVWPNLVVIEFLAVLVFTIGLFVTSWVLNAPLGELANPDKTPNPAKAPWYFLNLQELLLHMDPALAGVILPSIAVLVLMAIPYLDDVKNDANRWFTSSQGLAVTIFSAIYTATAIILLEIFDNLIGVKRLLAGVPLGTELAGWVVPVIVIGGLSALLMTIVHRKWQPSRRYVLMAWFTGFFVTYIVLTIFGTAFRGTGMEFFWPWAMPHIE